MSNRTTRKHYASSVRLTRDKPPIIPIESGISRICRIYSWVMLIFGVFALIILFASDNVHYFALQLVELLSFTVAAAYGVIKRTNYEQITFSAILYFIATVLSLLISLLRGVSAFGAVVLFLIGLVLCIIRLFSVREYVPYLNKKTKISADVPEKSFFEQEKERELSKINIDAPKHDTIPITAQLADRINELSDSLNNFSGVPKITLNLNDDTLYDELLPPAIDVLFETNQASVSMLQRRLKLGYSRAERIVDQMEEIGIVGPFEGSKPRQILVNREQYLDIYSELEEAVKRSQERSEAAAPTIDYNSIIHDEENWRREMRGLSPLEDELRKIDFMDGHDFENYCAELLRRNGYEDVEVTRGSGDHGVDITAVKDGLKYAVQCKRQSADCGNKPVQEVTAGKAFYHCHLGAVMTNRYFTQGAKDLAEVNGILLWDRDTVTEMLKSENP